MTELCTRRAFHGANMCWRPPLNQMHNNLNPMGHEFEHKHFYAIERIKTVFDLKFYYFICTYCGGRCMKMSTHLWGKDDKHAPVPTSREGARPAQ